MELILTHPALKVVLYWLSDQYCPCAFLPLRLCASAPLCHFVFI